MSTLNASIVNIANPVLSAEFGISMAQVQWATTIYLIVNSSLMLMFGRVGDRVGAHRIYITGVAIFTLGSFACAIESTFVFLLLARALQGLGASMMVATSMGLVVTIFPLSQRGRAMGITVLMVGLGNVTGPVVGGIILAQATWHMVFLISVPFGFICFILAALFLRSPVPRNNSGSLDVLGSLMLAGIITSLIIFLSGGFEGQVFFGLGVIVFSLLFFLVEKRGSSPILDTELLKNKRFASGNLITFFSYCAYMMMIFQLPFFLQTVWEVPVGTVGLWIMVSALTLAVTGPLSGIVSDKVGALKVMPPAILTIIACFVVALCLGPNESVVLFMVLMVLSGVGMGFLNTPNNSDIMTSAGRAKSSYASGFVGTNRNLGFAMGTALSASIFTMGTNIGVNLPEVVDALGGGAAGEHLFAFKIVILVCLILTLVSFLVCLELRHWVKGNDRDDDGDNGNLHSGASGARTSQEPQSKVHDATAIELSKDTDKYEPLDT